jgi:hypothetical protein
MRSDGPLRCVGIPASMEVRVSQVVDFENVSVVGLESSPVAEALAGLRANEARYYRNKYGHVFTVEPADDAAETVEWVHRILREERDIVISARPLEATAFEVDGLRMAYVFYESGLAVNVMYGLAAGAKRAVGFKLSDGMDGPRGTRVALQVRQAEVEARRHHPRLLLRHQGRVLRPIRSVLQLQRHLGSSSAAWPVRHWP